MVTKRSNTAYRQLRISIHTTTQVVTKGENQEAENVQISIHTTTQVVTDLFYLFRDVLCISIHTTTQVVTGGFFYFRIQSPISIHTTTQVVTALFIHSKDWTCYFNPHHHAGGDSKSTQLFILISVNFHINLLLQPLTTSKPSKSIPKTPTIPDSPGANLPGVSWVLPIRTGVSEN